MPRQCPPYTSHNPIFANNPSNPHNPPTRLHPCHSRHLNPQHLFTPRDQSTLLPLSQHPNQSALLSLHLQFPHLECQACGHPKWGSDLALPLYPPERTRLRQLLLHRLRPSQSPLVVLNPGFGTPARDCAFLECRCGTRQLFVETFVDRLCTYLEFC
jgi:hypothetical protein